MALHKGLSSSAKNKDEERTGNNYEDNLDPEGKVADEHLASSHRLSVSIRLYMRIGDSEET
ncbi:uncharacterized protein FTOL_13674 [Fusarium torulosum]|uniref:Uncharacterized protein n=1 Tax=Fusarium torulosum TaxID=33205 RepID=A0AAE8MPT3_9HYPO|nr:uncharacterized protein FTOL_13674 [Fusarium torulosum]